MKTIIKKRKISAVLPVHNEEKTLNTCLNSVKRQNVDEIIIILDKCTDNSERIARKHAEKDSRIRIWGLTKHKFITNHIAETVNIGFLKAQNDIILITEADTVFGDNYVSAILPHLKKPVVSVAGRYIPIHKKLLQFRENITGTGRLLFRSVWEEVEGFQDILACDTLFDLELMKRGYKTKIVDEAQAYDLRNYSMRQLTMRSIRRGKGRRQNAQSPFFMFGHGLYTLTKTPFGIIELLGNIAGYFTAHNMVASEGMKRYEKERSYQVLRRLLRR